MIVRVFLEPDAACWVDMQTPLNLLQLWAVATKENCISADGFIVPVKSVHHLMALSEVGGKPSLNIVPFDGGGKPN